MPGTSQERARGPEKGESIPSAALRAGPEPVRAVAAGAPSQAAPRRNGISPNRATPPTSARSGAARSVAPRRPRASKDGPGHAQKSRQGAATHPEPSRPGVVVVDAVPLFRTGAAAALAAGGLEVLGEAGQLAEGIALAGSCRARAMVLGGASVEEAKQAVIALPSCAVVALLAQPSRAELVNMLAA
ncbi:MAG TPA: hypothetical protein VME46_16575, partial [Acidimicrobiales bacterium]|nr:hypothetical protein [Acidimicrobiales bacterium]